MTVEETEWFYGSDPLSEAGKFYVQIPVNDRITVWEKCEILFLNIMSWGQVSSISFSGTKNALIFSFFKKIVHHIPPPFYFSILFI